MKKFLGAAAVGSALLGAPFAAQACGGLFCDSAQPVVQSAERILFARDGDRLTMHVRLTYAGPPQAFGWLLPVPRDVQTSLSSEALFTALDSAFTPQFLLQQAFEPCDFGEGGSGGGSGGFAQDAGSGGGAGGGGGAGPTVSVLTRGAVGPYDRAVLDADNVRVLRLWLDENGFSIPESVDTVLQPYIDAGAVFVAIKLLPGTDSQDVVPLELTFTGDRPAIPLLPTSVAATPDMGILVHVLGDSRAIPENYRHVQINERSLDWLSGGSNYTDVVSQAADEAGGRAFTTDFAGPHEGAVALPLVDTARLADVRTQAQLFEFMSRWPFGDPDVGRVVNDFLVPPDDVDLASFAQCPDCYQWDPEAPVDGEALAARMLTEVVGPREAVQGLFARHRYMTRLYSTMSAEEMREDPIFSFNDALPSVARARGATAYYACDPENFGYRLDEIRTDSGLVIAVDENGQNPDIIRRTDGETTQSGDASGAAVIEQFLEAGEPEIIRRDPTARAGTDGQVVPRGDSGCGCRFSGRDGATSVLAAGALLALLAPRRRRGPPRR